MDRFQDLSRDDKELALKIAQMHVTSRRPPQQEVIAKALNTSQPVVSRLMRHVRDQHWLKTELNTDAIRNDRDSADLLDDLLKGDTWASLIDPLQAESPYGEKLAVHFVIPGNMQDFAPDAAVILMALFARCETVATMWGRTAYFCVRECERLANAHETNVKIVVPACGEPQCLKPTEDDHRFSASLLAFRLQEALTGKVDHMEPHLLGVPAYIPSRYRSDDRPKALIQDFIENNHGYKAIFKGGTIAKADLLLTGAGIVSSKPADCGSFITERLKQEPVSVSQLKPAFYGDLGGLLIPYDAFDRDRLDINEPDDQKGLEAMLDGWAGMTLEQYRSISKRAVRKGLPGVVAVVSDPKRAVLMRAACRMGYVSTVIVSASVAAAMAKDFERDGPAKN